MKTMAELSKEVRKCTRCGNCQYYCPSFSVSRLETHVARGRLQLVKNKIGGNDYSEAFVKRMSQCLLCGNCSQNCPAGINTEEIIEEARELCTQRLGPLSVMERTAKNIIAAGNITADAKENRLLWFQNMEGGMVRTEGPAEFLYLAGCVSTLYPSSYSIPQNFSLLLDKAGVDWATMGERENCCAYPLLIGGMREAAVKTAMENVRDAGAYGAKNIVTTCPSCYHTWKETYPRILPNMPEVKIFHGTQLLAKLVREGKFRFKETPCTVTYHDPCDLGRKSRIYDEPREILKAIPGVKLMEMKFNRENAMCCGGGGNLEMSDSPLSAKVAQLRIGHALDTKADIIVSSCQQCKRTLAGGVRQKRARIKVMDLTEFMMNALE